MKDSLQRLHEAGKPVLVRMRNVRQIEAVLAAEADVLCLDDELMDSRALQDEVDRLNTPVVLCKDKRHRTGDWLVAVEHIVQHGNRRATLGEAGTLSFESEYTRRLDVDAIMHMRHASHLSVAVNITRLWHSDMPQNVLYRLTVATGANGVIGSLK